MSTLAIERLLELLSELSVPGAHMVGISLKTDHSCHRDTLGSFNPVFFFNMLQQSGSDEDTGLLIIETRQRSLQGTQI